ncbi:hypothetical protein EHI46_13850 [Rhizobium leguminosarum]|nr:hypothetical protein EHI46_13850 [Rhizobium leguminosarum]
MPWQTCRVANLCARSSNLYVTQTRFNPSHAQRCASFREAQRTQQSMSRKSVERFCDNDMRKTKT